MVRKNFIIECDAYRQRLTHPLTGFSFFLNLGLVFALVKFESTPFPCSFPKGGITYSGSRNTTHSELSCQNWAVNEPHVVDSRITDDMFPDGSKEAAKNYCRNPFLQFRDGVWCYTMNKDVEWQYCDICKITYEGYSGCKLADRGVQYRGKLAHTISFQACEPWTKHPSNRHQFAEGDAETNKDYCRNPDPVMFEAPMCFIAEVQNVTWEYCDICKPFRGHVDHRPGERGVSYSGIHVTNLHALACLRLCVSVESCTGAGVQRDLKQCYIVTKFKYELASDDSYDRYIVQRVCISKAAGKGVHFVDSPGVMSLTPSNHDRGSVERCEKDCFKAVNCVEYSRNAETEECLLHDSIYDEIQLNVADTLSRFKIRCVPTLKPSKDVAEAGEESRSADKPAEKPTEKPADEPVEKSTEKPAEKPAEEINQGHLIPAANKAALLGDSDDVTTPKPKKGSTLLIVIIVVAISALGIGGFVYYKLGYAKWLLKGNEKAPDDAVVKPPEKIPGTAPNKGNEKDPLNAQATGNPKIEGNIGNEKDPLNAQATGNPKIEGNIGNEKDPLIAQGTGNRKIEGKHRGKGNGKRKSKAGLKAGKQKELQKLIPVKQLPGLKQSKVSAVNKS